MLQTHLKNGSGEGYWDNLTLVIAEGDVAQMIRIKDRQIALDLTTELWNALSADHTGALTVRIYGQAYTWAEKTWHDICDCLWQWTEELMCDEATMMSGAQ